MEIAVLPLYFTRLLAGVVARIVPLSDRSSGPFHPTSSDKIGASKRRAMKKTA
jgi:hypothetical protein